MFNDDQRKHRLQMSSEEISTVEKFMHEKKFWSFTARKQHLMDRMREKKFTPDEALSVLKTGNIIEVHANNYPEIRIVMRKTIGRRDVCICATADGIVVTGWANAHDDSHSTLNKSKYQLKLFTEYNCYGNQRQR